MSEQLEHLRRLLTNEKDNLRLIEERISEFVEKENIPLDLVKNQRKIQTEIGRILNEIEKKTLDQLLSIVGPLFESLENSQPHFLHNLFWRLCPLATFDNKKRLSLQEMLDRLANGLTFSNVPRILLFIELCLRESKISDTDIMNALESYKTAIAECEGISKNSLLTRLATAIVEAEVGIRGNAKAENEMRESWSLLFALCPVLVCNLALRKPEYYLYVVEWNSIESPFYPAMNAQKISLDSIDTYLADQINETATRRSTEHLRVEFFLPDDLLIKSFDNLHWSGKSRLVAHDVPIVVRSFSRTFGFMFEGKKHQHLGYWTWKSRWQQMTAIGVDQKFAPDHFRLLNRNELRQQSLESELKDNENLLCIGILESLESDDIAALCGILNAGIPIILWPQKDSIQDSVTEKLLHTDFARKLPKVIMHHHRGTYTEYKPGIPLSLLWDDYERIPNNWLTTYTHPIREPAQGVTQ